MSQYLDYMRSQARRRSGSVQLTSKSILMLLAFIAMGASAVYWWGVQSTLLPANRPMALAFTAILVLAPPALTSFLIPWSPGGMLLQKVNAKTWGHVAVVGCAVYLLYYSFQIQWSWWAAQPVAVDSGLVYQQVLIGIIGFIIIPALLFAPVSSDELVEQVRQAHLVKRYELQTQADIAILRATLLRAQEMALIGFANLTADERGELAGVIEQLVSGIDRTLKEVGQSVKTVSGAHLPFSGMLDDNDDIRDVLDYISASLTSSTLHRDHPVEQHVDTRLQSSESHEQSSRTALVAAPRHVDSPSQSSESREAPDTIGRQVTSPDDAYARAGRSLFGRVPWELKKLAKELDVSETTAREMKDEWLHVGVVKEARLGRWYFTESERVR